MRLADYVAKRISEYSDIVYMVTGGGAMHLNDAFGRSSEIPEDLTATSNNSTLYFFFT